MIKYLLIGVVFVGCGVSKEHQELSKQTYNKEINRCAQIATSYSDFARCTNLAAKNYFNAVDFQYMDAIYAANLDHLEYARMVEAGQITPEEALQMWGLSRKQRLAESIRYRRQQEAQRPKDYKYSVGSDDYGTPIYTPDECIGPVIMGECKGTILPKPGYRKKCYGTMLNGKCTGPAF